MKTYIQINPQDNVCVALAPISAGTQINAGTTVTTLEDIPQGHKIALADIKEGEKVIKYSRLVWQSRTSRQVPGCMFTM